MIRGVQFINLNQIPQIFAGKAEICNISVIVRIKLIFHNIASFGCKLGVVVNSALTIHGVVRNQPHSGHVFIDSAL